jgi:hypothetical protein
MVLLQLSAQSFLSTDEARTHARVIVQTGLIDPDRPSYDMNVLYPHHIWEVRFRKQSGSDSTVDTESYCHPIDMNMFITDYRVLS